MNVARESKNLLLTKALPEPIVLLMVTLLAMLAFLPGLGAYRMLDPTDSFFQETAREMMELRHYVTPLFNYSDWLDKPALPFLLIVACYKLFGISAWAARLPSALSGVLLVIWTYWSARKFLGRQTAFLTALVLCSSPLFSVVGHVALSDEPLSLFFGVAMLGFAQALIFRQRNNLFLTYVNLTLAVLCKGPIGLVLSLSIIFIFLIVTSDGYKTIWKKIEYLKPWYGIFILSLGSLPYYILAHATTGGAFTQAFFLRQNLGRFAGTVNHQEPFWWYLPVFLGGFLPWTVSLLTSGTWFKHLWLERKNDNKRHIFLIFCSVWVIFILAFFSAIPTKLPTYIVLISPALAIIVGAYMEYLVTNKKVSSMLITALVLLVCAGVAIIIVLKVMPILPGVSLFILLSIIATSGLLILHMFLIIKGRFDKAASALIAAAYLGCALLVPLFFCQFYEKYQAGLDRLIETARVRNANLATLFSPVPSATFSYGKKIENINTLAELTTFCKTNASRHWLLARDNCLNIPQLRAKEHTIDNAGRWYLLSVDNYLKER